MSSVRTAARRAGVPALIAGLAATAAVVGLALPGGAAPSPGDPALLLALGPLVVAASLLVVRFRAGRQVDSVTLVEAVLAPLLFAYAGPRAVLTVAAAGLATAVVRRTPLDKSAFNIAMWSCATALGSAATLALAVAGDGLSGRNVAAVAVGLLVIWTVNNAAFTAVMVVVGDQRPAQVLRALAPLVLPGWLGGFAVNVALGLLYVAAFAAAPATVLLFPVPLVLLHLAYRGYAVARSDRLHLAGLHRSAQALTREVDPHQAVAEFLSEVAAGFDAASAVLVLDLPAGLQVHVSTGSTYAQVEATDFARALLEPREVTRLAPEGGSLGRQLTQAGHRSGLVAPLVTDGLVVGALAVLDRAGLEGLPSGEVEVLAALARETAATFERGALLSRMLEDRRRLSEIVESTSDGILTLTADGVVESWNPALERLTGLTAAQVTGVPGALSSLQLRELDGRPVDLAGWSRGGDALPPELRLSTVRGERRALCTYDSAIRSDDERTLVVVVRDVTPVEDLERMRQDFHRLVEAEAAQRLVVEHLQQAVMPAKPSVGGNELGVAYVASDPTSPTGGDLYDCQLLPSGELYLAVVDVLGHGVAATQAAVTVMHTLRTVVLDQTPLEQVVGRADVLLGRQDPDLVATVVLALYDPTTGVVRVVSGGHPPALVVSAQGEVRQLPAQGCAIGWPGAGTDAAAEAVLEPGDSLVLYTDGLIEARKDVVQGLEELEASARDLRALAAPNLADALVGQVLAGAERRDDTLALVLRRSPVHSGGEARSWRVDPAPHEAAQTRRDATAWLRERGVEVDDIALALGELLANAVEHARTSIEVEVTVGADGVLLEVRDDGPGFDLTPRQRAADDAEGGRGLAIVQELVADLHLHSTPAGTVARAHLVPAADRTAAPATPERA